MYSVFRSSKSSSNNNINNDNMNTEADGKASGLEELQQLTELLYISYLLSLKAAENIQVQKKESLTFQLRNIKKFLIQIQELQKRLEIKCQIT